MRFDVSVHHILRDGLCRGIQRSILTYILFEKWEQMSDFMHIHKFFQTKIYIFSKKYLVGIFGICCRLQDPPHLPPAESLPKIIKMKNIFNQKMQNMHKKRWNILSTPQILKRIDKNKKYLFLNFTNFDFL